LTLDALRKMFMTRLLIRAALLLLAVFACKPGVPPAVLSTLPVNGQTEVPLNTQIRVAFSEAMDTASVEAAFSFHPPTAGAFEWGERITDVLEAGAGFRPRRAVHIHD